MGYTTPYARKLYRILSNKSFLFTEMIATKSLIYSNNRDNIIDNDFNNPVALQVGGSEIKDLQIASKIALDYNYDEINLNVGCPSKAVQKGSFGACLMDVNYQLTMFRSIAKFQDGSISKMQNRFGKRIKL